LREGAIRLGPTCTRVTLAGTAVVPVKVVIGSSTHGLCVEAGSGAVVRDRLSGG